jgi:hypothetical protein
MFVDWAGRPIPVHEPRRCGLAGIAVLRCPGGRFLYIIRSQLAIFLMAGKIGDLQQVIAESKEVRRSVDYLERRPEMGKTPLAYMGVSERTAYGMSFTAPDQRAPAVSPNPRRCSVLVRKHRR